MIDIFLLSPSNYKFFFLVFKNKQKTLCDSCYVTHYLGRDQQKKKVTGLNQNEVLSLNQP